MNNSFKIKKFSSNFISLATIRILNIGTKFFLTAYLIRVLGTLNFGILTWSESILQYFIVFINFGFNIIGVKLVSEYYSNEEKLKNIVSSIYHIKLFLFFISFIILSLMCFNDMIRANSSILFLLLLSTIADVLFPIWYFQGIQKIDKIVKVSFISKLFLILLTLFLVLNNTDTLVYVAFFLLSQIIFGVYGFSILKKNTKITLIKVNFNSIKEVLSLAKYYVIGNFSMLIFNALTIFLIGINSPIENVSGFDITLKIVMVSLLPVEILQAISLPLLTKNNNSNLLKKLIFGAFFYGVLMFIFLKFFGTDLILLLGGNDMLSYTNLINKLAYLVLFVPITYIIGQCALVAFNAHKSYNFSLIITALLYIICIIICSLCKIITFDLLVDLRIYSDLFLFIILVFFSFKHRIFSK